jgi:hypothetical protein
VGTRAYSMWDFLLRSCFINTFLKSGCCALFQLTSMELQGFYGHETDSSRWDKIFTFDLYSASSAFVVHFCMHSVCSCFESTLLLFFRIQLCKLIRHELAWTSLSMWDRAEIRNFLFWHERCYKCTKLCLLFVHIAYFKHCQTTSQTDINMVWVLPYMVRDFALIYE